MWYAAWGITVLGVTVLAIIFRRQLQRVRRELLASEQRSGRRVILAAMAARFGDAPPVDDDGAPAARKRHLRAVPILIIGGASAAWRWIQAHRPHRGRSAGRHASPRTVAATVGGAVVVVGAVATGLLLTPGPARRGALPQPAPTSTTISSTATQSPTASTSPTPRTSPTLLAPSSTSAAPSSGAPDVIPLRGSATASQVSAIAVPPPSSSTLPTPATTPPAGPPPPATVSSAPPILDCVGILRLELCL